MNSGLVGWHSRITGSWEAWQGYGGRTTSAHVLSPAGATGRVSDPRDDGVDEGALAMNSEAGARQTGATETAADVGGAVVHGRWPALATKGTRRVASDIRYPVGPPPQATCTPRITYGPGPSCSGTASGGAVAPGGQGGLQNHTDNVRILARAGPALGEAMVRRRPHPGANMVAIAHHQTLCPPSLSETRIRRLGRAQLNVPRHRGTGRKSLRTRSPLRRAGRGSTATYWAAAHRGTP